MNFAYFFFRFSNFRVLSRWNYHIVDTNRYTRQCRVSETGVHDLVSEDNGVFQTQLTVCLVEQVRNLLLT
ncbi:Uncharacterised protein [Vibrio cholerae]|uniref:Uncharacterized protein n=1 Tax=Vibrio cholerae TaxID=666 RepID=A0A655SXB6_VIBCL|nr:Uncharacterised protein [Vibrio cholerae]CSD37904.1 Uncharacterised protein [Vibrio cholerae]CSD47527.1 Uncharacterised protein [Vibrio cholerae]CSD69324.1 Uncharacterised protein [Vibrio cholerae]CSD71190.1 Uncharacterised protein [Vibrio cholerae]